MRSMLVVAALTLAPRLSAQSPAAPRFDFRGMALGDSIEQFAQRENCRAFEADTHGLVRCFSRHQSIGSRDVTIAYTYLDNRLVGISVVYHPDAFDDLRAIFSARYGEAVVREQPFKTRGGLETLNTSLTWAFREGEFVLAKYSSSLESGSGSIVATTALDEMARRREASAKEAAARDLGPPVKP